MGRSPRRAFGAAFLACCALAAGAQQSAKAGKATPPPVAIVGFLEGKASVVRQGGPAAPLDIGSDLFAGDLVRTEPASRLAIEFDKSTGIAGSISMGPATSLALNLGLVDGEQRTHIELFTGSVAAKVKKLAGKPSLVVEAGNAAAGVRGTEFQVIAAPTGASLVICTEGAVVFSDETGSLFPVAAGAAFERRESAEPRRLDTDPKAMDAFAARWMDTEMAAFASDPVRAIAGYEARYSKLMARLSPAWESVRTSAILRRWQAESRAGARANPMDPAVMRDKKAVFGTLKDLRSVLFLLERVYFRLDTLRTMSADPKVASAQIGPGYTVADFWRRVDSDLPLLQARVAEWHWILALYAERDDGMRLFDDWSWFGDD